MFAILKISDQNTILRRPKIKSQRFNLPSDDAFFIVTVDKHFGKAPWKKLEKCLGILRKDVVLPDDIKIPDNVNITAFKPDIFPRLLLINSAVDCIMKNGLSHKESLCIFDERGIYTDYIEKLINFFSSVKVITPFTEKYEDISRKLLRGYGFSLIISSQGKYGSDTVISHSCDVPLYFKGRIYTSEKKYLMNAEVFSGGDIELPEEYEKLCPDNIDRLLFASALYEKCGISDIGELRYSDFGS